MPIGFIEPVEQYINCPQINVVFSAKYIQSPFSIFEGETCVRTDRDALPIVSLYT